MVKTWCLAVEGNFWLTIHRPKFRFACLYWSLAALRHLVRFVKWFCFVTKCVIPFWRQFWQNVLLDVFELTRIEKVLFHLTSVEVLFENVWCFRNVCGSHYGCGQSKASCEFVTAVITALLGWDIRLQIRHVWLSSKANCRLCFTGMPAKRNRSLLKPLG